jgi:hypothetical protein
MLQQYSLQAQTVSLRAGIWDFTDMTASEIYRFAPTIQVGLPLWKHNQLCLEALPGFSFRAKSFNENYHYLYMVPLVFSMNYTANNSGGKVLPVFSAGASLLGKADNNVL